MEIDGVTYHDIGEYECIAISTGGYASERLYVDVAGEFDWGPEGVAYHDKGL